MPSKTEKQKRFFGAVMGAKKGQKGSSGKAKKVAKDMSKGQIKDFLETEEDEESKKGSKYRDFKKSGKVELDAPKVKERKVFAPPTKKHQPKKGKGSYNRKNFKNEDEENPCWDGYSQKGMKKKGNRQVPNCVKENKQHISKMIDSIIEKNYAQAHKYLERVMNSKLQKRIADELDKPLF